MVLQVSQAARSGLLAAYLAEQGARASETSLEGPIGFYYAFTGGTEGVEQLADHLGTRWEIMDVTLKRYPTSMFNQPPIHTMLALTQRHDLRPEEIESVLVEMNDFETTYPSVKFAGSGYSRRRGTGATGFVVAAACVNRGFSIPPDRPLKDAQGGSPYPGKTVESDRAKIVYCWYRHDQDYQPDKVRALADEQRYMACPACTVR